MAYTISPPLFIDADATGRAVMPIGQVMIGILAGVAAGVILLIYLLRKNRHHFR